MQVGDMVDLPGGRIIKINEIIVEGKRVAALPWVAAKSATITASPSWERKSVFSGEECSPRRLTPERELGEILQDGRPRTAGELAEETGWGERDLLQVLEAIEENSGTIDSVFSDKEDQFYFSLTDVGKEMMSKEPPLGEDRLDAYETETLQEPGNLSTGDIVDSRWGPSRVESIALCYPERKDGPEVELVPWAAAGGRDFVVTLSNGHWSYGNQIKRRPPLQNQVLEALSEGSLSREALSEKTGVSFSDMEGVLDDLEVYQERICGEQVFTEYDEQIIYSLTK